MRYPAITVWPTVPGPGDAPALLIVRGQLATMKVRLDEAHSLADQLVDMAEQMTEQQAEEGGADGTATMR